MRKGRGRELEGTDERIDGITNRRTGRRIDGGENRRTKGRTEGRRERRAELEGPIDGGANSRTNIGADGPRAAGSLRACVLEHSC